MSAKETKMLEKCLNIVWLVLREYVADGEVSEMLEPLLVDYRVFETADKDDHWKVANHMYVWLCGRLNREPDFPITSPNRYGE